jgi:tetratricopeptide (TPR) repeat protein
MAKGSKAKKRRSEKPRVKSKPAKKSKAPSRAKIPRKAKNKAPVKPPKAAKAAGASAASGAASKKASSFNKIAEPPRLLRETKTTTAALVLLERGIKLIYQKEFKKARNELKSLLESYPAESEILARARTYLQICEREEAAHRKPALGNEQLYPLGVMEHNRGEYDKAVAYFRNSLDKNQKSDHIYYSLAASLAMKGESAEALRNLQQAVELNEENRVYAKNDSDFSSLHGQKEFDDLMGWSPTSTGGQPQHGA